MKQFISKDSETGIYYFYYLGGDGKRKRTSLKTLDYEEAVKNAELLQNDLKAKNLNTLDILKNITLSCVEHNHSKGTYELYKTTFTYLIEFLGNKLLDQVTIRDLESFKGNRLQFVKVPTVNIYVRIIKASFNMLMFC